MIVALKHCLFDTMFLKPKYVWEATYFFNFRKYAYSFQLFINHFTNILVRNGTPCDQENLHSFRNLKSHIQFWVIFVSIVIQIQGALNWKTCYWSDKLYKPIFGVLFSIWWNNQFSIVTLRQPLKPTRLVSSVNPTHPLNFVIVVVFSSCWPQANIIAILRVGGTTNRVV